MMKTEQVNLEAEMKQGGYGWILRRIMGPAVDVLGYLQYSGALDRRKLRRDMAKLFGLGEDDVKNSVHKLKSYGLVCSTKRSTNYYIDITQKGLNLLEFRQNLFKQRHSQNG